MPLAVGLRCFQGKPWQFKEFPFKGADKGDLVETFSNIFGAYFHYKDEKVCNHSTRKGSGALPPEGPCHAVLHGCSVVGSVVAV